MKAKSILRKSRKSSNHRASAIITYIYKKCRKIFKNCYLLFHWCHAVMWLTFLSKINFKDAFHKGKFKRTLSKALPQVDFTLFHLVKLLCTKLKTKRGYFIWNFVISPNDGNMQRLLPSSRRDLHKKSIAADFWLHWLYPLHLMVF